MTQTHTPTPWKKSVGIKGQTSVTVDMEYKISVPAGYNQNFGATLYLATNASNQDREAIIDKAVLAVNSHDALVALLGRCKESEYNPFEPDNQSKLYEDLVAALKLAKGE